jgi:hypothetical protein
LRRVISCLLLLLRMHVSATHTIFRQRRYQHQQHNRLLQ